MEEDLPPTMRSHLVSEPNHALRAARERTPSRRTPGTCMSRDEVADLVVQWLAAHDPRHREVSFDGNHLGKLERGAVRRPRPPYIAALCAVLNADETELGFGLQRHPIQAVQAVPEPVSWATDRPWKVGPEAFDALRTVLAATRRLEDTTSAAAVLPTVDHHVGIVDIFAREARVAHRQQVITLASELHTYRGWLAIDTRDYATAEVQLRAGITLAVESGADNLLAESLGFSARREWLLGNHVAASSLRQSSLDRAHSTATRVIFGLHLAQTLASAGDRAGSDRALLAADRLLDRFDETELDDWLYYCTVPFLVVFRGSVHALAGRKQNAVTDLTDGLKAMPADHRNAEWAREYRDKLAELA